MEQQNNVSNSLAVRILSVVGGLLAALCFILFLGLSDVIHSKVALSVIGIGAIVGAIIGNRMINHLFLDTSITAFYVAGCIALCMGSSHWNVHLVCFIFMLIAVSTFLCSKGVFFPFLAVLLFNTAFTWFLMEGVEKIELSQICVLLAGAVFLLLNLYEARIIASHPAMKHLFRPLHTGFFFSFACGLVWISGIGFTFDKSIGVLSFFIWVGIVLVLQRVMKTMKVEKSEMEVGVYVACIALLLPTIFAPALSGALLLLLLCFAYGYKAEMGASLLLLIYTITKYYYDLQLTLLAKSCTLLLTGVVLLLAYYYFTKYAKSHEEI